MELRGIVRFWTESSVYEVDASRSLMRRLAGIRAPTTNQGVDGRWRTFARTTPIRVGDPVLVTWESPDSRVARRTITSPVVGIADGESGKSASVGHSIEFDRRTATAKNKPEPS